MTTLAAALAACGSSSSSKPVALPDLINAELDAECQQAVRCGAATDQASCLSTASLQATVITANMKAAIASGRTTYDADGAGDPAPCR